MINLIDILKLFYARYSYIMVLPDIVCQYLKDILYAVHLYNGTT